MRDRLIELLWCIGREYDEYCDDSHEVGLSPMESFEEMAADHLLANGVIVPPVAMGGTVYTIRGKKMLKKWKVLFIGINSLGEIKLNIADKGFNNVLEVWDCDFWKNVFITTEDAEKELKERNNV